MRTWEILYEHEEKLPCCEGEVALEQALEQPQGGCGVSFPGDIKKKKRKCSCEIYSREPAE